MSDRSKCLVKIEDLAELHCKSQSGSQTADLGPWNEKDIVNSSLLARQLCCQELSVFKNAVVISSH